MTNIIHEWNTTTPECVHHQSALWLVVVACFHNSQNAPDPTKQPIGLLLSFLLNDEKGLSSENDITAPHQHQGPTHHVLAAATRQNLMGLNRPFLSPHNPTSISKSLLGPGAKSGRVASLPLYKDLHLNTPTMHWILTFSSFPSLHFPSSSSILSFFGKN